MKKNTKLIIRAVTAILIIGMLLAAILINPWIAAGLPPVLAALVPVLREINGRGDEQDNDQDKAATGS